MGFKLMAKILFAEVCQCLNTINILQIALSLQNISIKHINIKINVYLGQPGFQKGLIYFVMIRLFVIYLSYLNIDKLLQIKFVKMTNVLYNT
jgi:hypothetical protein